MSSFENVNIAQCSSFATTSLLQPLTPQVLYLTTTENLAIFVLTQESHRIRMQNDTIQGRRVQEMSSGNFSDVNSRIGSQFFDKIVLRGHGTSDRFTLSSTTGGTIALGMNGKELYEIEIFCRSVNPGGIIILESCSTGAERDNILKFITSLCRDGVCVVGSRIPVGLADDSSGVINYDGLFRHFRFVKNHSDDDVTRIYYKSSQKVQNIPINQLDFIYEFLYYLETKTKGGLRDDDDYFTSNYLYELALRALGERNNPVGIREVRGTFNELLTNIFGDINDTSSSVCSLDSPIKLMMRDLHLKKSEVSRTWQALLTDLESLAATFGHDATDCQLEMLPGTHDELVSKGTIYLPGKANPYAKIYHFFLGCAYVDKYKPIFMLLDNGKELVDNPGIMSACALAGFAFHGVDKAPFSVVLENFFDVLKNSYRVHQKNGNLEQWFTRFVSVEPCFNARYNAVLGWKLSDDGIYSPEAEVVRMIQEKNHNELETIISERVSVNYYSSLILNALVETLINDFSISYPVILHFFVTYAKHNPAHRFLDYFESFLCHVVGAYLANSDKNKSLEKLFIIFMPIFDFKDLSDEIKVNAAKKLLDFQLKLKSKSLVLGDEWTVDALGVNFVAGIVRTLENAAKIYCLDEFYQTITTLKPIKLNKSRTVLPMQLTLEQVRVFFEAGINKFSKSDAATKRLFENIQKDLMYTSLIEAESFYSSIKSNMMLRNADQMRLIFRLQHLPDEVNKLTMYESLIDFARTIESPPSIFIELILGFQIPIEVFPARTIFKTLNGMTPLEEDIHLSPSTSQNIDVTLQLENDLAEMGVVLGKDFRSIGIDFDWIDHIRMLDDSFFVGEAINNLETQFRDFAAIWKSVTAQDHALEVDNLIKEIRLNQFNDIFRDEFKTKLTRFYFEQSVQLLKVYAAHKVVILDTLKKNNLSSVTEIRLKFKLKRCDLFGFLTKTSTHPPLRQPRRPTRSSSKRQRP